MVVIHGLLIAIRMIIAQVACSLQVAHVGSCAKIVGVWVLCSYVMTKIVVKLRAGQHVLTKIVVILRAGRLAQRMLGCSSSYCDARNVSSHTFYKTLRNEPFAAC